MTGTNQAVFLSYASQDAGAARRIAEALRAAGIEVWFDQTELRGGDVWDRRIREQIRDCALLIPIISANTQERPEGYFRLEWKLAVERTHLMSERVAFLVPVVIDDIRESDADVPQKFREVQWSRLPRGETPPAFAERVGRLLAPSRVVAAGDERRSAPRPSAERPRARRPAWAMPVLAATVIAIVATGYFAIRRYPVTNAPAQAAQPNAQAAVGAGVAAQSAIPDKSIAVLPFVDMSEKKDQEYFSDGLAEEMIDLLSQVQDLRVPARTSSFSFKGKADDIPSIARKLRVAHVLEGSVRKSGNAMRVSVELIRADSGYTLWSKTYSEDFQDVFKMQDSIAAAVVEALKVKLGPTPVHSADRSTNAEAYDLYLLARHYSQLGGPEDWRRASDTYRKAIALDPNYASAYAALSRSEYSLGDHTGDDKLIRQGLADAEKAIGLAPDEADGYASRGFIRFAWQWDWSGAQADLAKALEADPNSAQGLRSYASLRASLGQLPEAIAMQQRAAELDPLLSGGWANLGIFLTEDGDYPAAAKALQHGQEIEPGNYYLLVNLAELQLLEGHASEALATARAINYVAFQNQVTAMAQHSLNNPQASQQALDKLIATDSLDAAYQIAGVYAWRGQRELALQWLERAYQQRDGGLSFMRTDPLLKSLRAEPRFVALVKKMNFPQ